MKKGRWLHDTGGELIRIIANYRDIAELQTEAGQVKTWEWALRCGGSFSLSPPGRLRLISDIAPPGPAKKGHVHLTENSNKERTARCLLQETV